MEIVLPEAIADDCRPPANGASGNIVGRDEHAAKVGPHAEHAEGVAAHHFASDGAQRSLLVRDGEHVVAPAGESFDALELELSNRVHRGDLSGQSLVSRPHDRDVELLVRRTLLSQAKSPSSVSDERRSKHSKLASGEGGSANGSELACGQISPRPVDDQAAHLGGFLVGAIEQLDAAILPAAVLLIKRQ